MSLKRMQNRITRKLNDWFEQDPGPAEGDSFAEAGLDDVVQVLESIEHPRLSSAARDRIWQAALEQAEALPAPQPAVERRRPARKQTAWRPRRVALRPALVAIFLAIAMCFSSFGVTLAAQQTYPNDTLYPVKRLSEDVWFSLASESGRPRVAMELLIRRMEEVEHLARRQEPIPAHTLNEVETHLRWIEQAERSAWEENTLERLDYHIRALEDLAAQYPDNAQLSLALSTCQRAYEDASGQPYVPQDTDKELPAEAEVEPTVPPTPTPRRARQYDPPQWDRETPPASIEESPQSNPTPQPDELEEGGGETDGTDEGDGTTPPPTEEPPPVEVPPDDDHVPPGQELTPPGQELTPPGQEDKENTPPGQEHTPPGQEHTPPGQDKK